MSSISTRQRRSRRRATQGRIRSVEVISLAEDERNENRVHHGGACIDLTCEDDDIIETNATTRPVVDLTNVTDSPIVILGTPDSPPRRRRRRRAEIPHNLVASDSDEDLLEWLELLPFDMPEVPPSPVNVAADTTGQGATFSPDATVSCPICLDTTKEIRNSRRHIFSTNCGHIFCEECIKGAIKAQKKCPTCRKKLTLRQIHPIFI